MDKCYHTNVQGNHNKRNNSMSNEILNLNPKEIWKHFYSLTQIPRPSKKEERNHRIHEKIR